jgi:glucosamine--fructose-6-phosphate aminotransferase (isomerizing)
LQAAGHKLSTETDSEVIVHLITDNLSKKMNPAAAAAEAISQLEGTFALAIIFKGEEDLIIAARQGPPLAVGSGDGEMYIGSDAFALAPLTNRITYLEDGDWAEISRSGFTIRNRDGQSVERQEQIVPAASMLIDKGGHKHFMAKEIFEQPEVIVHTLASYIDPLTSSVQLPEMDLQFAELPRLMLSACGTAFYSTMVAKYWFERLARIPVEIDIASEFRYRESALPPHGLAVFVSQSGETADTLAALRYCREQQQHIVSIVNVDQSSIARESDFLLPTHAGPEIGVASTKAFTCQLVVLACLAIATAKARGEIDDRREADLVHNLMELPRHMAELLQQETDLSALSYDLSHASSILYLGRGALYPIALEGALKLKEISYIHAEGYAAGELKHGPIALIDEDMPVVVIAPYDDMFEKTVSNMLEVIARAARVILISDAKGIDLAGKDAWATIEVPQTAPFVAPIMYTVPVQLLAYQTAVAKGTDVDQPRNLAKSVTVE